MYLSGLLTLNKGEKGNRVTLLLGSFSIIQSESQTETEKSCRPQTISLQLIENHSLSLSKGQYNLNYNTIHVHGSPSSSIYCVQQKNMNHCNVYKHTSFFKQIMCPKTQVLLKDSILWWLAVNIS